MLVRCLYVISPHILKASGVSVESEENQEEHFPLGALNF